MVERSSRGWVFISRLWCVRRCLGSRLVEHGPVAGEGLGHAARIGDADAVRREAEQRERHGHAVVVVGLDERGLGPARLDHKAVGLLAGVDAGAPQLGDDRTDAIRSEEHTSELQSLMRISYAVFCLKNKT